MSTLKVNSILEKTGGNGVVIDGVTIKDGGITDNTHIFNVINYGAVGNGVADDTTAIVAAVDAAVANGGGIVRFPPGTYLISNTINITGSNVTLEGAGAGASIIRAADGSEALAMIVVGDGNTTCAHTEIHGLLFDAVNQKTANQAIKLQKCFKTWIWNVRIEKQYNSVYILNSTETFFRDSDIRDSKNDGIIWESAAGSGYDLYLNNVVADNPNVVSTGNGLNWIGGENFVIQNCDFLHFNVGMHIHPGADHQCRFGFFINAEFDFAIDNCIKISGADNGDVVGMTFTNTWSGTAGNYGVLIAGGGSGLVQGIRMIGHKSMHNGLAGIRIDGGLDIHLTGCDVIGNSQTSANTRSGIEISANVGVGWSIVGCKSGNGYQQGDTQDHGINVDGSHTYDRVLIMDNDLTNNTNAGLQLNDAVFTSGKIFGNAGQSVNYLFEDGAPEIWIRKTGGGGHTSKILDDGNLHIEGESQNVWINGASVANVLLATGGGKVGIGVTDPTSKLSIVGLPTSAAGLKSGDIWANSNVLTIVP